MMACLPTGRQGDPVSALEIPEAYQQLSCVLLTSPTAQSGTSLLQRVLNGSQQIIIYGENQGVMLTHVANFLCDVHVQALPQVDYNAQRLARIVAGDTDFWHPDLLPDVVAYARLWRDFFYGVLDNNQQFSQQLGRSLWGVKQAGLTPLVIARLRALLPQLKVIYVYRNVYDVLSAAKAKLDACTPQQVKQLAVTWQQNMMFLQHPVAAHSLCLCYEEIVRAPSQCITQLQTFLGVSDLSLHAFATRINTIASTEGQYIPPSQLTAEERTILYRHAGKTMQRYYPDYCDHRSDYRW